MASTVLPFSVAGRSDVLPSFCAAEAVVDVACAVMRQSCWRCGTPGATIVSLATTLHRSEGDRFVFVGGEIAFPEAIDFFESVDFGACPWPIGSIRSRFSKRMGGSYLSAGCPSCDAIWGVNPLRAAALPFAARIRAQEASSDLLPLGLFHVLGNPLRLLVDEHLAEAVATSVLVFQLMDLDGAPPSVRLFLATKRGLEWIPFLRMDSVERRSFAEHRLAGMLADAGAHGYAVVWIDEGEVVSPVEHAVAALQGASVGGLQGVLVASGRYRLLQGSHTDAVGTVDHRGSLIVSECLMRDAYEVAWPDRVLPSDRILPLHGASGMDSVSIRGSVRAASTCLFVTPDLPIGFVLPLQVALGVVLGLPGWLDAWAPGRLAVLCEGGDQRAATVALARDFVGSLSAPVDPARCGDVTFLAVDGVYDWAQERISDLVSGYDLVLVMLPWVESHPWLRDRRFRAAVLSRFQSAATTAAVRIVLPLVASDVRPMRGVGGGCYWSVAERALADESCHVFGMTAAYAQSHRIPAAAASLFVSAFYFGSGGFEGRFWFANAVPDAPLFLPADPAQFSRG